jgi:hypothetical protein
MRSLRRLTKIAEITCRTGDEAVYSGAAYTLRYNLWARGRCAAVLGDPARDKQSFLLELPLNPCRWPATICPVPCSR